MPKKSAKAVKSETKAKSYLEKGLTAKEYQALRAKTPICWSDRRIAVVKAMRSLGAVSAAEAVPAGKIVEKAKFDGLDIKTCKIHLDVYRGNELLAHGFAKSIKHEGSRELSYYLTAAGKNIDFAKETTKAKKEKTAKTAKKKAPKAPKAEPIVAEAETTETAA